MGELGIVLKPFQLHKHGHCHLIMVVLRLVIAQEEFMKDLVLTDMAFKV